MSSEGEFEQFVARVGPRLRRALVGHVAPAVVPDVVAEAWAYAWEHWQRVRLMENPAGFLFRVAQSRSRRRMEGMLPAPSTDTVPVVEPALMEAMRELPMQQRSAVWLVHACGWSYREAAEALGVSASAVGTHVSRGMARLRERMGAMADE